MAPHPVDHYVGRRLRSRRTLLGMSQENLGEAVGVTFQQIQKYERGLNRIGASRLYEFSRVLGVPVAYFFEDFFEGTAEQAPNEESKAAGFSESLETYEYEKMGNKEVLTLVRSFHEIEDPLVRKRVLSLIKSLATPGEAGEDLQEEDPQLESA